MLSALLSECIGTFIFFSCILTWGQPIPIAVGLLAAIYIFGKISGGHFNPAVSFMMFLKGDINMSTFIAYVAAQLIGAILTLLWWRNTLGVSKK
jgi:glycerol uptake facilitator-like aquaporin